MLVFTCAALETQQTEIAQLLSSMQKHFEQLREIVKTNIEWAKEVVQELEISKGIKVEPKMVPEQPTP